MQKVKINGQNMFLVRQGVVYNPKKAEFMTITGYQAQKAGIKTITEEEFLNLWDCASKPTKRDIENKNMIFKSEYIPLDHDWWTFGINYKKEFFKSIIETFVSSPDFEKVFDKTSIQALF